MSGLLKRGMLAAVFSLSLLASVFAEELFISTGRIQPWTIDYSNDPPNVTGFFGEIMVGALRNADLEDNLKIEWFPWKRAQKNAQRLPNRIIGPLTRTEPRENLYIWVSRIVTVTCSAYSVNPFHDVGSVAALEKLALGSLAGSPPETEVLRLFPRLRKVMNGSVTEEINVKKLLTGRIDAWVTQDVTVAYYLKQSAQKMGKKTPRIYRGKDFFDQPIWVAVSKGTKPEVVAKLREAFEDFKKTEEYRGILTSWGVAIN